MLAPSPDAVGSCSLPLWTERLTKKRVHHHHHYQFLLNSRKEGERSLSLMLLFPVSPSGPQFVIMPTGNKVQNKI